MLQILIKFVFKLVVKVFTIILTPLLSVVFALFPDISRFLSYIFTFFDYCSGYVTNVRRLLLIPNDLFLLFFDYIAIRYSIYLGIKAFNFIINVYNKLKP